MSVELASGPARPGGFRLARRPRRRLDRYEVGLLTLFGLVSLWVLALDLYQVLAHGRVWTGTDGLFIVDQLQYLSWISSASHHLLVANLYVTQPTPADYFQPAVAISGGISALGVPTWLSLLVWKPVAVVGMFLAVRSYARASLEGFWSRRIVLALGLFFGSFTITYGQLGVVGDLFPGFLSWGYTFGLMAIAAMLGALVAYERARRDGRPAAWTPALLSLLAGLLHPWQAELTIFVVGGTELALWWGGAGGWGRRSTLWRDPAASLSRLRLPLMTLAGATIPLVYYALLGAADASWGMAKQGSRHSFSLATVMIYLLPLLIPAALGYRLRARGFLAVASRVWPLAALLVYALSTTSVGATPQHAFEGVTVPLAVLAVQGVRGLPWLIRAGRRRAIVTALVTAATVPSTVWEMKLAPSYMSPQDGNANFITTAERDALRYLQQDRVRGAVLTRFYLGAAVPGRTGRSTYIGSCLWSRPDCDGRAINVQALLDGKMTPQTAQAFVASTGARFILADCQEPFDVRRELDGMVDDVHRFGCATVYEIAGS